MTQAFEVWGDPIDHSLSPTLHRAAYTHLGLDATYERRRVVSGEFDRTLAGLAEHHRGLSITFPLKAEAFAAATIRDRRAQLTGAVNTLVLGPSERAGFNTDVGGIVQDLREHGIEHVDRARVVGAGATATSAVVALNELGASHLDILARRPDAARELADLAIHLGMTATTSGLQSVDAHAVVRESVPVTVSTLPGGARLSADTVASCADAGGMLYDVVYGHWPTALATAWEVRGETAVNGLGMLLHQAVLQVRAFVTGSVEHQLDDEPGLVAVMRRALMGD